MPEPIQTKPESAPAGELTADDRLWTRSFMDPNKSTARRLVDEYENVPLETTVMRKVMQLGDTDHNNILTPLEITNATAKAEQMVKRDEQNKLDDSRFLPRDLDGELPDGSEEITNRHQRAMHAFIYDQLRQLSSSDRERNTIANLVQEKNLDGSPKNIDNITAEDAEEYTKIDMAEYVLSKYLPHVSGKIDLEYGNKDGRFSDADLDAFIKKAPLYENLKEGLKTAQELLKDVTPANERGEIIYSQDQFKRALYLASVLLKRQ